MIRRLRPGDEELHVALAERFKQRAPTLEQARRFLADERNWLLAALDDDGRFAGIALAYFLPRWDGGTHVFLYELEVVEGARRQGYGRALVEEVKRLARASGASGMWVTTDEANEPAQRLYATSGATFAELDAIFSWTFE